MPDNATADTQNRDFDISKFWAFRLVTIVAFVSLFILFMVLLIPIPYLHNSRKPCIIDLNLNSNGHSHAVKIFHKKLPGRVLSASFTTHNADHIIGTVTFGDITIIRDGDYLARYVNGHYHDRRKGLPYRVMVVDVYAQKLVFRKFLSDENRPIFSQIDHAVYYIPHTAGPRKLLATSLQELRNTNPRDIVKTYYVDQHNKLITHYQAAYSMSIGDVTLGNVTFPFLEKDKYRTVTTVSIKHLNVLKIIIATVSTDSVEPTRIRRYVHLDKPNVFYESVPELVNATNVDVTEEMFLIDRHEKYNQTPEDYERVRHKNSRLLQFELKHPKYRYDIVFGDQSDVFAIINLDRLYWSDEPPEGLVDRVVLLEFSPKDPIPTSIYIFDRTVFVTTVKVIKE